MKGVIRLKNKESTLIKKAIKGNQAAFEELVKMHFNLDGEQIIENFALQDTILQFDFSSCINKKELAPFTVELPK